MKRSAKDMLSTPANSLSAFFSSSCDPPGDTREVHPGMFLSLPLMHQIKANGNYMVEFCASSSQGEIIRMENHE